jgi:hypothetical protein
MVACMNEEREAQGAASSRIYRVSRMKKGVWLITGKEIYK